MELELQYTELSCCEAGESVTLTQEETLEAAIPEYCPEVTRIVDAVGQLCLREYTSRQISGSVLVTVLYTSEESPGLRSLTLPGAVSDPSGRQAPHRAATPSAWRDACC